MSSEVIQNPPGSWLIATTVDPTQFGEQRTLLMEGFGPPPLEAMACGAPVVCSHAASLPEVVGDAAILVNPSDVAQIADAMRLALTQPALAAALRKKGLARAAQFTWERTARETIAVYERVLAGNDER
jgi:glycosyltransferase involved in cell wall biosynthesis